MARVYAINQPSLEARPTSNPQKTLLCLCLRLIHLVVYTLVRGATVAIGSSYGPPAPKKSAKSRCGTFGRECSQSAYSTQSTLRFVFLEYQLATWEGCASYPGDQRTASDTSFVIMPRQLAIQIYPLVSELDGNGDSGRTSTTAEL